MSFSTAPLVSVVLIHFHSGEQILRAVRSVQEQEVPLEIIVVDNDSRDVESQWLAALAEADHILYLPQSRNLGFSDANNLAFAKCRGEFVLTLNADVELDKGFLRALVDALTNDPAAGSASGKLRLAATPDRIDTTGILLFRDGAGQDRGQGNMARNRYDAPGIIFGASGAAALYRRAMLDELAAGGEVFRSAFFAFLEDVDLAARVTQLGWRCLYVPTATAAHVRGGTAKDAPFVRFLKMRNEFVLFRLLGHWGAGRSFAAHALLLAWRLMTGNPKMLWDAWRDARVMAREIDPWAGLPKARFDSSRLRAFLQPSYLLYRLDQRFRD